MKPCVFSLRELEEKTLLPGKITAIVPTSTAKIEFLQMAIASLLERSNPDHLEHIICVINGPDSRTGDTTTQDEKQIFLENLRNQTWHGRSMPLTVQRVWSRIGHAQSLEMAIPWVHTEYYLSMHDDVIITNQNWTDIGLKNFANNPNLAIQVKEKLCCLLQVSDYKGLPHLCLPHLTSFFSLCRKSIMTEVGCRWIGYHVEEKFRADCEELMKFHYPDITQIPDIEYNSLSQDIGVWVRAKLKEGGYDIEETLPKDVCAHFGQMSWCHSDHIEKLVEQQRTVMEQLAEDLENSPLRNIYDHL